MEWYEDENLMSTWDWEKNQDIALIRKPSIAGTLYSTIL